MSELQASGSSRSAPPGGGAEPGSTRAASGGVEPSSTSEAAEPETAAVAVLDQAGRQLRAPWAASTAGLLFSVLFTAAMVLLRTSPLTTANDAELRRLFADGQDLSIVVGGLYLAPFAGVMFP
jgi:hypothetical protein